MKSIYIFVAAVLLSVLALIFFYYLETIIYGVILIFFSLILAEYGISKRLIEERTGEKIEYIEARVAEIAFEKSKKEREKRWEEFKKTARYSSSAKGLSGEKFLNFITGKKMQKRAERMKSNGLSNQIIGREIVKEFKEHNI